MSNKKGIKKPEEKMKREEVMKLEIAEELGLSDKVLSQGWKSLSSRESGKIGGIMSARRRKKEDSTATEK